jgi:hypothetical protein
MHCSQTGKYFMHRKLCLLVLISCLLAGCSSHTSRLSTPLLRYDGVYSAKSRVDGDVYCEYLRFYPDSTVITVSSECPGKDVLQDIRKWFSQENAGASATGVSKGSTRLSGNKITFDAVSKEGSVSYIGKISGKRLSLSSYSHINEHRDHDTYQFIAW